MILTTSNEFLRLAGISREALTLFNCPLEFVIVTADRDPHSGSFVGLVGLIEH